MWVKTLYHSFKRNGWRQLFFYLSNLDIWRFMEYDKVYHYMSDLKKGGRIVDLGSGYSVFPAFFRGMQYTTVDLSEAACKYQRSFGIDAVQADMTQLPFASGSVAVVVAISSVEHVPDDKKVFHEISRVLENDGVAFLAIPYSDEKTIIKSMKKPKWQMDMLNRHKKLWRILMGEVHLKYFLEQIETDSIMRCYSLPDLRELTEQNGLTIAQHEFIGGRKLVCGAFRFLPFGWFVLKDLLIGWPLYQIEQLVYKKASHTGEILLKIQRKRPA